MNNTWFLLKKELSYYGIELLNDNDCKYYTEDGELVQLGIIKALREIKKEIKEHKIILKTIWDKLIKTANKESEYEVIDEKIKKMFIFSLKDLARFLSCFDINNVSKYSKIINECLNRDIKSFSKEQVSFVCDCKISIDWIHRFICRLQYICKLLSFAAIGKKNVSKYNIKLAAGVSGPWSNLDLPMKERAYPYEDLSSEGRMRDKQRQRRYRKGLENYNKPGVGEGHYWREIRNQPYSWADRKTDSPYPSRELLMR